MLTFFFCLYPFYPSHCLFSVCVNFLLWLSYFLFLFPPVFFFFLIQIEEFSSGFWEGTKLACWMKGENPWRFFPKLSIYLRATNTSESFRITILPQVPGTYIIIIIIPSLELPSKKTNSSHPHFLSSHSFTSSQSRTLTARWTASVSGCRRQQMAWWSAPLLWKVSM